jgi:DNA-binding NtrC family response regulator
VGRGSLFRLYFPAGSLEVSPEESLCEEGVFQGSGRVLVVDDEQDIREAASVILAQMGFEPIEASDGRKAVDLFIENKVEIRFVLLDLTMPHMGGAECLRIIRENDPYIPVLLTSGFSDIDGTGAGFEEDVVFFIQKPYRKHELELMVRKIMEVVV